MHDSQRRLPSVAPRSVEELAVDPAWELTRTGATGRWVTAEYVIEVNGREWRIGLTSVTGRVYALIAWVDDLVVAHTRGDEATLCTTAFRWISDIHGGITLA